MSIISFEGKFSRGPKGFSFADSSVLLEGAESNRSTDLSEQQRGILSRGLGEHIAGTVRLRTEAGWGLGSFGGGAGLVRLPLYSEKPLSIPAKKTSLEEPSLRARRTHETIMGQILARQGHLGGLSSADGRIGRGTVPGNRRGTRQNTRQWVRMRNGYKQMKQAANLAPGTSGMKFSGKLLSDIRATVKIIPNVEGRRKLLKDIDYRIVAAITRKGRADSFTGEMDFGASRAYPYYEVISDLGFATERSRQIAEWQERGAYSAFPGRVIGNRPPRFFMGFSRDEEFGIQAEIDRAFDAAFADKKYTSGQATGPPVEREASGRFFPVRF